MSYFILVLEFNNIIIVLSIFNESHTKRAEKEDNMNILKLYATFYDKFI
jgi:hypothetical protein